VQRSNRAYDAIVVGAGHAGIEAALAVARRGFEVLLLTMNVDAIAKMSCNPAIGGIAKGHLVREIDALGGEMGLAIDATGIQFRMLNRSKGPAVWAPRAQADKKQYQNYMTRMIQSQPRLHLKQAEAVDLIVENRICLGVRTRQGEEFFGRGVILTTGTFLGGLIHIGETHYPGGRGGEPPAVGLTESLIKNGLRVVRFKTGTPARVLAKSIQWKKLEEQKGDDEPQPFSFRNKDVNIEQMSCYITYTNEKTKEIILKNLHRSPLYAGKIEGIGPRYCPSIEDKMVKFPDKSRHQIYLEPEGRDTQEIYLNGLSTSLPHDVQEEFIHSISGLESAEIVRLGYAIEYDCCPPTQLYHSLEAKAIENLFLAGQINCTSGYEEAAAQGLMAGINLVNKLEGSAPFVLDRSQAYIGVMIDDLVTVGTNEPYRLFTSRAEFRLLLRQDNADQRLMTYGFNLGLIPIAIHESFLNKQNKIKAETERLKKAFHEGESLYQWIKRPGCDYGIVESTNAPEAPLNKAERQQIEAEIKYEGYISRQLIEVHKFKKLESKEIPKSLNFERISGISREAQEKLARIKPLTLGHASRIPGISPCDISVLAVFLRKVTQTA
jgi:tRNA uridine 5-carboxymethylaminomethyl modification enzyme